MTSEHRPKSISRKMVLLFAVTGGAAVGNLYWAQPLLVQIAASLGISVGAAGSLITATQLGYTMGVLLLVPLGDAVNRRRLIPAILLASAMALFVSAMADSYATLLIGLAAVGLTTVSGQILLPLAGDLSSEDERGRVMGSIASGLLTGILLSRTISGLLADSLGWQSIYLASGLLTMTLAAVMAACLPSDAPRRPIPYGKLLLSIIGAVKQHEAIPVTLLIGASAFCVFTMFWTGMTFLLSAPPFSYSVTRIGLVGLVGLAGALAARRAGRLHDLGVSTAATGAGLCLVLASLAIALIGAHSIVLTLVAVLLIDVAIQGVNVLNQTRLLSINPDTRSRLNTAFVVCNFIGGALGSTLAGLLWQAGEWSFLISGQAVVILIALLVWAFNRSTLDSVQPRPDAGRLNAGTRSTD